jgi:putative ABC transport system permease protein
MGIVGVMGCMALLVCAFGLQNSLDDMSNWQYRDIYRFDSKLEIEENVNEQELKNIIDNTNGEVLMEGAIEVKVNGVKKSGTMLVTDDTTLIKYTDKSRRFIDLPKNGISISYKLANLLGVKIGDKVEWHIYGEDKWVYSKISEIYRVPISQGVVISKDDYDKLGYDYKATSVITSEKVSEDLKGVNSKWTREQLIESYDTLSEAMNTLVYICIFAAALLAIVVLYNLGVISFVERERELATLKVMGFKRIKIAKLLLTQTIILTILGMIIGAPIGKALIEYMCSFLGDDFDMMVVINPSSIIYSIIITLGLSIIVNLMFSRKIKDIDMVSSLKGVE